MTEVLNSLKPLEDITKKNSVYLVLREAVGCPEPPKPKLLQFKVERGREGGREGGRGGREGGGRDGREGSREEREGGKRRRSDL